ncbi:hypothetical protein FJ942_26345 [Mesorhizobium sp. B2-4-2]|nr:hypothetical protein FJ942_26345 [Mesorhizobium sp. B2-4-2]
MFIARLATLAGLALLAVSVQAHALTAAECLDKFNAAKTDGTLNGRRWTAFKNSECGPGSKPASTKEQPIDELKNEMKQAGYSEQRIQIAFAALNISPIASRP